MFDFKHMFKCFHKQTWNEVFIAFTQEMKYRARYKILKVKVL